jgi:MFS family permease
MGHGFDKTSTWLALRNPAFRKLWLAMVISGSCVAAQNTAIYWALNTLGATSVLISLMTTVSALPAALFTLPGGTLADMMDRKQILLAVQLWQAAIAVSLAILWGAHLMNPYLILTGAFLFSLGFAFSSPASSAVIAEMVFAEELASAYTLSGLQLDVSGIIGSLLGGLLISLAGVSVIFGANGVGFLLMLLAVLQWKRVRPQSNLPLETFFESLTTAIRYVRYTVGIKILLARQALFSFFISIIPALMPVVGLKVLHLEASNLGYLFTAMASGSVLSGAFALPWARARYSPEQITAGANLVLLLDLILMMIVHQPYVFLGVAALGGAGWTASASELWVASQRAMPDWARGRMSATITMVAQGATALGGALWGLAAQGFGVVPTFVGAVGFALVLMVLVHVVPALNLSIDFTTSVTFELAPLAPFLQNLAPSRLPAPQEGPISIIAEFQVDPARRGECVGLMREARLIFLRIGAYRCHLYEDLHQPNVFRMEVVVSSWKQYRLQSERLTTNERDVVDKLRGLHTGPNPPEKWISLSLDRRF